MCVRPPRAVPRLRNHATQSAVAVTEFEDDVSGWGRQVMEDQDYEDDEMSHASLSSGLSPRESRPRARPWDLAEGYKVKLCTYLPRLISSNTFHCSNSSDAVRQVSCQLLYPLRPVQRCIGCCVDLARASHTNASGKSFVLITAKWRLANNTTGAQTGSDKSIQHCTAQPMPDAITHCF